MITFDKNEIASILLLKQLAEFKNVKEKLRYFSIKYKISFKEFMKKAKSTKTEQFEIWDDYMEWKALINVSDELSSKIEALKSGHYKIA